MSRTLHCENGNHDWQYPGGRGRPPRNCPQHKVEKKSKLPSPDEVPVVRRGESEKQTEQRETANNPFIQKAQKQKNAESAARMQKGKAEKKVERVAQTNEQIETEYLEIDGRIERAGAEYDEALSATKKAKTKEEIEKAFNRADHKQDALLGLLARKHKLEALVERMTSPDSEPIAQLIPPEGDAVWRNSNTDEPLTRDTEITIDDLSWKGDQIGYTDETPDSEFPEGREDGDLDNPNDGPEEINLGFDDDYADITNMLAGLADEE